MPVQNLQFHSSLLTCCCVICAHWRRASLSHQFRCCPQLQFAMSICSGGQPARAERFYGQPLYCESGHGPEDVLYSGSEDEYYASAAERKGRYEAAARRFLEGETPLLLSTKLSGPFSRKSGWQNPWRSGERAEAGGARRRGRHSWATGGAW